MKNALCFAASILIGGLILNTFSSMAVSAATAPQSHKSYVCDGQNRSGNKNVVAGYNCRVE